MTIRKADAPLFVLSLAAIVLAAGISTAKNGGEVRHEADALVESKEAEAKGESAMLVERPATPSVAEIAGRFGGPRPKSPAQKAAPPPRAPAERALWLHAIGAYEDSEGHGWVLVKDDRDGRVIKLRADGSATDEGRLLEGPAGTFVVEAGSKRYSFGGR